jgi:hypothetical protein
VTILMEKFKSLNGGNIVMALTQAGNAIVHAVERYRLKVEDGTGTNVRDYSLGSRRWSDFRASRCASRKRQLK